MSLALALATIIASPYGNNYAPHAVATASMGSFFLLAEGWAKPALPVAAMDLRWPDDKTVDWHSERWLFVSDAGLATGAALGLALALGVGTESRSSMATNTLVVAESVLTTAVIGDIIKYAFRRPRPVLYQNPGDAPIIDDHLSFPSLHTGMVAAVTTSATMTWALAHPGSHATPWLALGSGLLTGVTGLGRVLGGEHFFSDVLAGAAIGVGAGYLIPTLAARIEFEFHESSERTVFTLGGQL